MCPGQEATHAHTYAARIGTLASTLPWIHAILSDRAGGEKKKRRKAIETEIDKRDEEITRADAERAKANMSSTKGGGSRSGI